MTISGKDQELLALLGENARAPVAAIARKLGLSRTTVQAKIERLEREGIIAGYRVRLSEKYLGTLVRAHVLVTISPRTLTKVTTELGAMQSVRWVYSVSGPYDLIVIIEALSISDLDSLIDRVGAIDGVERTVSSIILSTRVER